MIPLLLALTAIGLALALPSLLWAYQKMKAEAARQAAEAKARAEAKKQRKIAVIKNAGGLLAREFKRVSNAPSEVLEVLYVAASQQDVHFDIATERTARVVPYPTAMMDYVQIDDVSQLPQVSPDQMVLDDCLFYQRFVTRELMRPQYLDVVEKFKRLYVLVDASPSMFEQGARMPDGHMRDTWARGVAASLLMDAINGFAEFLFRRFGGTVGEMRSAMNPQEAESLLAWIVEQPECIGNTNIGEAVRTAADDIRKRQLQESRMSHILLITDGDDRAGLTREQLVEALGGDVNLHVILIGTSWPAEHPLAPYIIAKY